MDNKEPQPEILHPDTEELVNAFAKILAEKLLANQKKYGFTNRWLNDDWEEECRLQMMEHIQKGDPRDLAIYAFMWKRGWSTATPIHQVNKQFTFFPNHGNEDGLDCFTICYAGKDENGDYDFVDCVIVGASDTEEQAQYSCDRLNEIIQIHQSACNEVARLVKRCNELSEQVEIANQRTRDAQRQLENYKGGL
jgi:hypothetical protein